MFFFICQYIDNDNFWIISPTPITTSRQHTLIGIWAFLQAWANIEQLSFVPSKSTFSYVSKTDKFFVTRKMKQVFLLLRIKVYSRNATTSFSHITQLINMLIELIKVKTLSTH